MSLRVLICQQSIVSRQLTLSMTEDCLLSGHVMRILPWFFTMALLGAACGSDSFSGPSEEFTDDSGSTTDDLTPETDSDPDTKSDIAAETEESTNDSLASDTAGLDWPLSYDGVTVSGSQFNSGDYAGQDLVLWFWASW